MEETNNNGSNKGSKTNLLIGALAAIAVALLIVCGVVVVKNRKPAESAATAEESAAPAEAEDTGTKESEEAVEETAEADTEKSAEVGAEAGAEQSTEAGTEGDSEEKDPQELHLYIETQKGKIYELPLTEDLNLVLIDSQLAKMPEEITLESMGEMADPDQHDVNIIRVKDGKVSCIESNCDNQVCVATGEISGDMFDIPIVCLPHGAVISIE